MGLGDTIWWPRGICYDATTSLHPVPYHVSYTHGPMQSIQHLPSPFDLKDNQQLVALVVFLMRLSQPGPCRAYLAPSSLPCPALPRTAKT